MDPLVAVSGTLAAFTPATASHLMIDSFRRSRFTPTDRIDRYDDFDSSK